MLNYGTDIQIWTFTSSKSEEFSISENIISSVIRDSASYPAAPLTIFE